MVGIECHDRLVGHGEAAFLDRARELLGKGFRTLDGEGRHQAHDDSDHGAEGEQHIGFGTDEGGRHAKHEGNHEHQKLQF